MATKEDYTKFLKQIREETGIDSLVPDASGLVSVRVEDRFNVNLQFVEATGKVLCFVAVAQPVSAITETMTTAMPVNNLLITNPPLHTLGSKPGIQI